MAERKKNSPVQISGEVHAIVKRIAEELSAGSGTKVTIAAVLEAAVRAHYPAAFAGEPPPHATVIVQHQEPLFTPAEPIEQRATGWESTAPAADADAATDPIEEIFAQLVTAAFVTGSTPQEQNRAVEQLFGTVGGSFGQRIKLKDLAYHLRSTTAPISNLAELIADYEAGGASQLAEQLNN